MNRGLILIRHAMPGVVPGVSSKLWKLSEASKQDCVLLAHALPELLASPIVSSGQPKVDETAAVVALRRGLEVVSDARVAEVDQGGAWYEGDYRALAAGYLGGAQPPGWEPPDLVVRRFSACVDEHLERDGESDVVIVNHGLALSLYLAARNPGIVVNGRSTPAPFDLVPFWLALTFPDAWRLDLEANTLTQLHTGGTRAE